MEALSTRMGLCAIAAVLSGASGAPAFAAGRTIEFHLNTGVPNQKVFVVSELTMWENQQMAVPEIRPGEYSLTIAEPWLNRLVYKFTVDGNWISDPENPNSVPDGYGGTNSYYDLSFQPDPMLQETPGLPKWQVRTIGLTDTEGTHRTVYLAAPPAGTFANKRHVIVYFQDGKDYLDETGVLNLFANLSSRDDMPVFHGVFVPPKDRDREYGITPSSDGYVDFLTRTVVPAAERALGVVSPMNRLLIGPSLGGAITLYTTFKRPDVFPYAASQSGAQEISDPTVPDLIARHPNGKPQKLFMEIGIYEPADWIAYTRRAHEAAVKVGIPLQYMEYPSTHDWPAWENRLNQIFTYFFKK